MLGSAVRRVVESLDSVPRSKVDGEGMIGAEVEVRGLMARAGGRSDRDGASVPRLARKDG